MDFPLRGGSGIVPGLLHVLWTKNNLLQTRCGYHKCPPLLVPDTIHIEKGGEIVAWYSTSLKTGTLQRRTRDIMADKIVEVLISKASPQFDVVAVAVSATPGDLIPKTEFLGDSAVDYFLSSRHKRGAGWECLLQSFVPPKGNSNFRIRVLWTPEECVMDSCININKLGDTDLELDDRCSTHDEKSCVIIPLSGNVLAGQLQTLCMCIAEHVTLASSQRYTVTQMVLNFVIDTQDRVWLEWCEQLELNDVATGLTVGPSLQQQQQMQNEKRESKKSKTSHLDANNNNNNNGGGTTSMPAIFPTGKSNNNNGRPSSSSSVGKMNIIDGDEEEGDGYDGNNNDNTIAKFGKKKGPVGAGGRVVAFEGDVVRKKSWKDEGGDNNNSAEHFQQQQQQHRIGSAGSASSSRSGGGDRRDENYTSNEEEGEGEEQDEEDEEGYESAGSAQDERRRQDEAGFFVLLPKGDGQDSKKPPTRKPSTKKGTTSRSSTTTTTITAKDKRLPRPQSKEGSNAKPMLKERSNSSGKLPIAADPKKLPPTEKSANKTNGRPSSGDKRAGIVGAAPSPAGRVPSTLPPLRDTPKTPLPDSDDTRPIVPDIEGRRSVTRLSPLPSPNRNLGDVSGGFPATNGSLSNRGDGFPQPGSARAKSAEPQTRAAHDMDHQKHASTAAVPPSPSKKEAWGESGVPDSHGKVRVSEGVGANADGLRLIPSDSPQQHHHHQQHQPSVSADDSSTSDNNNTNKNATGGVRWADESSSSHHHVDNNNSSDNINARRRESDRDRDEGEGVTDVHHSYGPDVDDREGAEGRTGKVIGASGSEPAPIFSREESLKQQQQEQYQQFQQQFRRSVPGSSGSNSNNNTSTTPADSKLANSQGVTSVEDSDTAEIPFDEASSGKQRSGGGSYLHQQYIGTRLPTSGTKDIGDGLGFGGIARPEAARTSEVHASQGGLVGHTLAALETDTLSDLQQQQQQGGAGGGGQHVNEILHMAEVNPHRHRVTDTADIDGKSRDDIAAAIAPREAKSGTEAFIAKERGAAPSRRDTSGVDYIHVPPGGGGVVGENTAAPEVRYPGGRPAIREDVMDTAASSAASAVQAKEQQQQQQQQQPVTLPNKPPVVDPEAVLERCGKTEDASEFEGTVERVGFDFRTGIECDRERGEGEERMLQCIPGREEDRPEREFVPELAKEAGEGQMSLQKSTKERAASAVTKSENEWRIGEFVREEDGGRINNNDAGAGGAAGADAAAKQVIEIKFDRAFSTESERTAFAQVQREALARILNVPLQSIIISDALPGSPVTIVRYEIKGNLQPPPPPSETPVNPFSAPPLTVSIITPSTVAADAFRDRLKGSLGDEVSVVARQSIPPRVRKAQSGAAVAAGPAESAGDFLTRTTAASRQKGTDVSHSAETEMQGAYQVTSCIGEEESLRGMIRKERGNEIVGDFNGLEAAYRPARLQHEAQFCSASAVRRAPPESIRLRNLNVKSDKPKGDISKIIPQNVDNSAREKEEEDEMNFVPAERASEGHKARALMHAIKAEGQQEDRSDRLEFLNQRSDERVKSGARIDPSAALDKWVEEIQYPLANKQSGIEDPRFRLVSMPESLSQSDRRLKRKGKDGIKLLDAAVPEAYLNFGTEGESQRIAVKAVTLERPGQDNLPLTAASISSVKPPATPPGLIKGKSVAFGGGGGGGEQKRPAYSKTREEREIEEMEGLLRPGGAGLPKGIGKSGEDEGAEAAGAGAGEKGEGESDEEGDAFSGGGSTIGTGLITSPTQDKRMPKNAAAKSAILAKIQASEATLQALYSMLETDAEDLNNLPAGGAAAAAVAAAGAATAAFAGAVGSPTGATARAAGVGAGKGGMDLVKDDARRKDKTIVDEEEVESSLGGTSDFDPNSSSASGGAGGGGKNADPDALRKEAIRQARRARAAMTVGSAGAGMDGLSSGGGFGVNSGSFGSNPVVDSARKPRGISDPSGGYEDDDQMMKAIMEEQRLRRAQATSSSAMASPFDDMDRGARRSENFTPGGGGGGGGGGENAFGPSEAALISSPVFNKIKTPQNRNLDEDQLSNFDSHRSGSPRRNAALTNRTDNSGGGGGGGGTDSQILLRSKKKKKDKKRVDDDGEDDAGDEGGDTVGAMTGKFDVAWKPLFSKVRHGRRADVIAMISSGCPVDIRDEAGNTALIIACQNGNKQLVKALLRRGADLNCQNHMGQTPLHFCFTYGHSDLGNYLVSKGADETAQNAYGLTPYEGLNPKDD